MVVLHQRHDGAAPGAGSASGPWHCEQRAGHAGLAGQRGEVPAAGHLHEHRSPCQGLFAVRQAMDGRWALAAAGSRSSSAPSPRHEHLLRGRSTVAWGRGDRLQLAAVDPRLDGRRAGEATGEQRGALETPAARTSRTWG